MNSSFEFVDLIVMLNNFTDDYDRSINEAISLTKYGFWHPGNIITYFTHEYMLHKSLEVNCFALFPITGRRYVY